MESGRNGTGARNVLFLPHYLGSLQSTLLPLAKTAGENLGVRPLFLLRYRDGGASRDLLDREQLAWEEIDPTAIDDQGSEKRRKSSILSPRRYLRTILEELASNRLKTRLAHEVLDRYHPAAIFVVGEYPYFEAFLLQAANLRGIPNVLVQWTDTLPREYFDAYHRICREQEQGNHGRLSRWVYRAKDRMSAYVLFNLLGSGYGGLPRFMGDGNAARFAVMGPDYGEMFKSQGVSAEKVQVTGHPNHDRIFHLRRVAAQEEARREIKDRYGLDRNRPLILVGGDDLKQWLSISPNKDRENCRAVMNELTTHWGDCQVFFKPHPRVGLNYYGFLSTEYPSVKAGIDIDLAELMAVSEVYIGQASSTLSWALALGTPVISYDFDNLEAAPLGPSWRAMRRLPGVCCVDDLPEFQQALESVLSDPQVREKMKSEGFTTAARRMVVDGQATHRILQLAGLLGTGEAERLTGPASSQQAIVR